ncbi:hypothetical protein QIA39_04685 (plasmid) [Borreliella californiensis]|uniref:Uncharacterized protein n=2 Tax=Borreliella californiensis TaxID=373543 RepID=A0A7X0DQI5_9SPIR|nr:hypothetical protein [Borreliella californiensis]MBB6213402.1 hypothetical protein [Borreliella californiensis]MBB6213439.1 hypothetical protein [Borreliella californiensis]
MYEENNNENKFTITLEGVLDKNATKSNLKKEFLSLKRENFFSQMGFYGLSGKSSKDFLSLSLSRLKGLNRPKSDNLQKSSSFKSLNVFGKSNSFKDFLSFDDSRENTPKSVLKDFSVFDFDLKDKSDLTAGFLNENKSSPSPYLKPKVDKLDLGASQDLYFKTENIKNIFKQNFINNFGKNQTNVPKDFRLNSNFNKIPFKDLQNLEGFKNKNSSQIIGENLMTFRGFLKDPNPVDFFDIKNGFNDLNSSLREFKNLKDKKTKLSLENFLYKDSQKESVNKILKRERSFETELERNDFLRKLYILQNSQNSNSNSNDFSFMVELAQKLKNKGHAKNDSKAISLVSDFLKGENGLEKVLSLKMPTISLKSPSEPEVLNSKIISAAFEPGLELLLEKTLELLEWAKNYDFTSSVLDPLKSTFSNLGIILAQAFESLPLVENITSLLNSVSEFNSRGIDDDSRMP